MFFVPYLLWPEPRVVAIQVGSTSHVREVESLLRSSPDGTHLLCHCPSRGCVSTFAGLAHVQSRFPRQRVHLMANSLDELGSYRKASALPACHAPVSLYADDRTFRPLADVGKVVDAIHVAKFEPGVRKEFKRHLLARSVATLSVVTYASNGRGLVAGPIASMFRATFPELRHARVNGVFLSASDLCAEFNRARTHLALSAREGCMLAFTEGLLCGVPGVSTRCESARSSFFHPEYVAIVDDDADAVAEGVRLQASRALDSARIRRFALEIVHAMRRGYAEYIAPLARRSPADVLRHLFEHPEGVHRLVMRSPSGSPMRRVTKHALSTRSLIRRRWG